MSQSVNPSEHQVWGDDSEFWTAVPILTTSCSYYIHISEVKVKWHTAKYGDPCSELVLCIYPIQSAHTQQWTHTHREHTPGAVGSHLCCGARGAVGGSVSCSRAPQSWYWGWRERWTFTPPTYNSCRTWDSNSQPLDYKSDSLTIRPRLPTLHYITLHTNNITYLWQPSSAQHSEISTKQRKQATTQQN